MTRGRRQVPTSLWARGAPTRSAPTTRGPSAVTTTCAASAAASRKAVGAGIMDGAMILGRRDFSN